MLLSACLFAGWLITPQELLTPSNELHALAKRQHPIEEWTTQCTVSDYSNEGMLSCYQQAYEKWDSELNEVYRNLRHQLDTQGRGALRDAQRRWLDYRDAEFKLVQQLYSSLEGTMWPLIIAVTRVEIVRQRTLELNDYLETLHFEQLAE